MKLCSTFPTKPVPSGMTNAAVTHGNILMQNGNCGFSVSSDIEVFNDLAIGARPDRPAWYKWSPGCRTA